MSKITQLKQDELNELINKFKAADTNGDGVLDKSEVKKSMTDAGVDFTD